MRLIILAVLLLCHACRAGADGAGSVARPMRATPADAQPSSQPTAATVAATNASNAPSASIPQLPMELPAAHRAAIARRVKQAIHDGDCPGAAVVVVRGGDVVWREAFGDQMRRPRRKPLSIDALFDLASLTKPIVTATAIMQLVDAGKLRLEDRVAQHLPAFAANGKEQVSVAALLNHTSGMAAVDSLGHYRSGRDAALAAIYAMPLRGTPGQRLYSDLGYIVLGSLIEKLSHEPLDVYAERHIFDVLGMRATFAPDAARAVPTEQRDGHWLRGRVHDMRAAGLGGVAGHAGLFATADDVARFAQMLLAGGVRDGRRVLSQHSVERLIAPGDDPRYGLAYPLVAGGFSHTGFTGTYMWLDPKTDSALVLLTSRLHPDGQGNISELRHDLRAIVSASVRGATSVQSGIDVLIREGFARLRGRKVALVTNHSGRASDGRRTADVLAQAQQVELVSLFSPEHGLEGQRDSHIADGRDTSTGLPVYSLYGKHRRPRPAQLHAVDTIVFDIQDAGARFFTYATTLGYLLEAAAQQGKRIVVLDRPNPVDGRHVQGPLLDAGKASFIGYHRIPVRHGMTLGELARLFNSERHIGADLDVVAMRGWQRWMRFDDTGLSWIPPSPNLRSPHAALLYSGVALLEATNLSVGRGTDTPFELLGAPWLDGAALSRALGGVAGVAVRAQDFTPTTGPYAAVMLRGIHFEVTDPKTFDAPRLGVALALALLRQHPADWDHSNLNLLLGNATTHAAILRGDDLDSIVASWRDDLRAFDRRRRPHLLY